MMGAQALPIDWVQRTTTIAEFHDMVGEHAFGGLAPVAAGTAHLEALASTACPADHPEPPCGMGSAEVVGVGLLGGRADGATVEEADEGAGFLHLWRWAGAEFFPPLILL